MPRRRRRGVRGGGGRDPPAEEASGSRGCPRSGRSARGSGEDEDELSPGERPPAAEEASESFAPPSAALASPASPLSGTAGESGAARRSARAVFDDLARVFAANRRKLPAPPETGSNESAARLSRDGFGGGRARVVAAAYDSAAYGDGWYVRVTPGGLFSPSRCIGESPPGEGGTKGENPRGVHRPAGESARGTGESAAEAAAALRVCASARAAAAATAAGLRDARGRASARLYERRSRRWRIPPRASRRGCRSTPSSRYRTRTSRTTRVSGAEPPTSAAASRARVAGGRRRADARPRGGGRPAPAAAIGAGGDGGGCFRTGGRARRGVVLVEAERALGLGRGSPSGDGSDGSPRIVARAVFSDDDRAMVEVASGSRTPVARGGEAELGSGGGGSCGAEEGGRVRVRARRKGKNTAVKKRCRKHSCVAK